MKTKYGVLPLLAGASTALVFALPARADVVGRLHIFVKNVDTQKPIADTSITLVDPTGTRGDTILTPDAATGDVTTDLLENHAFDITVAAPGFNPETRSVTVVADTTSDVVFDLEPEEKTIRVTGDRSILRPRQTANSNVRNQDFIQKFPATASNPQQLQGIIATAPGVALDSANQAHVRGEHTQTSVYIGGFQLGGALVGRFGPLIAPDALQSADVQTGAYAPEYGSETAAIVNATVRRGTIDQKFSLSGGGGEFGTAQGFLSFSGQAGAPVAGANLAPGARPERKFAYFLNATARRTNNALETPQPDRQSAHNDGRAESILGRFDFTPTQKDVFTLTLNAAPSRNGIANRTGLSDRFAGVGQGYGFGGAVSRADAQGLAGTMGFGNSNIGLTQQQANQDVNQTDRNDFGVLQYRRAFSDSLSGLLSFGGARSKLDLSNNNPAIYQSLPADLFASRQDDPVEYSPTINRNGKHGQVEGSLTYALDKHTVKFGLSTDEQRGNESYNLIPGSQAALNALFGAAPDLAPAGTAQVDANGDPVLDANDNPVYNLTPGASAPTVRINRRGYYRAAYVQDTWRVTPRFTANYGLRYDMFKRQEDVSGTATGDQSTELKKNFLGPRLNLSYALQRDLVLRGSYNRLFIQPPLAEGGTVGAQIQPETLNQCETSLEKGFGGNQSVKLAYYYKQIRNQLDIALLVPGSQIGVYSAVNLANDGVHGIELSYNLNPRGGVGLGSYFSLARAVARFNDPEEGRDFNDHDQRYTLSSGLNYTLKSGALAAVNVFYGSGLASSGIGDGGAFGFSGKRENRARVDARLSTGPRLLKGRGGLTLDVENLLDDKSLINFNSDFSGTRFQQGRRIVLSANLGF